MIVLKYQNCYVLYVSTEKGNRYFTKIVNYDFQFFPLPFSQYDKYDKQQK